MRELVRWLLVVLVMVASVGCIYGTKRKTGTNLPPTDPGGPWTQGEPTTGTGGPATLTPER